MTMSANLWAIYARNTTLMLTVSDQCCDPMLPDDEYTMMLDAPLFGPGIGAVEKLDLS
jgi:hypothetical protein